MFSGEVLLTFEGRPRPLLDSLRFRLLNEEFIGFTFVSVVSFPSCYYICIVRVVRVRTILIFLERQLLVLMFIADVGRRPLSIVLGSVHTKKGRGWLHGGHCKDLFRVFIEPSPAYFAERF